MASSDDSSKENRHVDKLTNDIAETLLLPLGWSAGRVNNQLFYRNHNTQTTQWERPTRDADANGPESQSDDEDFIPVEPKQQASQEGLPPGWQEFVAPTGELYWIRDGNHMAFLDPRKLNEMSGYGVPKGEAYKMKFKFDSFAVRCETRRLEERRMRNINDDEDTPNRRLQRWTVVAQAVGEYAGLLYTGEVRGAEERQRWKDDTKVSGQTVRGFDAAQFDLLTAMVEIYRDNNRGMANHKFTCGSLDLNSPRAIKETDKDHGSIMMSKRFSADKKVLTEAYTTVIQNRELFLSSLRLFSDIWSVSNRERRNMQLRERCHLTFIDEPGVDEGGLTSTWYSVLCDVLHNFSYFKKSTEGEGSEVLTVFNVARVNHVNPLRERIYRFFGNFIGLCILFSRTMSVCPSLWLCHEILRQVPAPVAAMKSIDFSNVLETYRVLKDLSEDDEERLKLYAATRINEHSDHYYLKMRDGKVVQEEEEDEDESSGEFDEEMLEEGVEKVRMEKGVIEKAYDKLKGLLEPEIFMVVDDISGAMDDVKLFGKDAPPVGNSKKALNGKFCYELYKSYVQAYFKNVIEFGLTLSLRSLLTGIYEVVPVGRMSDVSGRVFTAAQLQVLLGANTVIDPDDFKEHIVVTAANSSDVCPHLYLKEYFCKFIDDCTEAEVKKLLNYATGEWNVPPGGFKDFQPPFTLTLYNTAASRGHGQALKAVTCAHTLEISTNPFDRHGVCEINCTTDRQTTYEDFKTFLTVSMQENTGFSSANSDF